MRLGWREAFFLQNYLLNFDYLIPASWSLCIEEHFYLGLPLLIPLLPRRRAVILLPVLILALTAIRSAVYLHALHGGVAIHHQYFYTRTHFRLENLMLGVWLALLRTRHPAMWSALMRRARWIGVIGYAALVAIVIGVFQRARVPWFNPFVDTVGFTLIGLCFACILIEARGENSILRHVPSRLTTPIALCSYSTYLTHHCLALRWTFMLVSSHKWIATTRCSMGIFLALTGIIAAIGYWGVEKPSDRSSRPVVPPAIRDVHRPERGQRTSTRSRRIERDDRPRRLSGWGKSVPYLWDYRATPRNSVIRSGIFSIPLFPRTICRL